MASESVGTELGVAEGERGYAGGSCFEVAGAGGGTGGGTGAKETRPIFAAGAGEAEGTAADFIDEPLSPAFCARTDAVTSTIAERPSNDISIRSRNIDSNVFRTRYESGSAPADDASRKIIGKCRESSCTVSEDIGNI